MDWGFQTGVALSSVLSGFCAYGLIFLLWWVNRRSGLVSALFWVVLARAIAWVLSLPFISSVSSFRAAVDAGRVGGEAVVWAATIAIFIGGLLWLILIVLLVSNGAFVLKKAGVENSVTSWLAGFYRHQKALGLVYVALTIVPWIMYWFAF